jgi:A/G-specific adenine glycosylase
MLGGMRALPGGDWGEAADASPPTEARWRPIGTVEHGFTHFTLSLDVHAAHLSHRPVEGEWWPVDAIDGAGLPTLYARAAAFGRAFSEALAA